MVASSSVDESGGASSPPQDTSGGRIMFSQIFGALVNVDVSQLQLFSPQQEGVTATFGDDGFTLTSGRHAVEVTRSITRIGEYNVNVNGYDFVSHMLSSATAVGPGSIIVTGRASPGGSAYWAFDPSLSGTNLADGYGGASALYAPNSLPASTGEPLEPFTRGQAHMAPGSSRHLTQAEINALAGVCDLSEQQLARVVITNGQTFPGAAATTWSAYSIHVASGYALADFSGSTETMGLLIHELYHSYQWLDGVTASRFVVDEIAARFYDAYRYTQADLNNYAHLNVETQASIQEDAYRLTHGNYSPLGALGQINLQQLAGLLGAPRSGI